VETLVNPVVVNGTCSSEPLAAVPVLMLIAPSEDEVVCLCCMMFIPFNSEMGAKFETSVFNSSIYTNVIVYSLLELVSSFMDET